MIAYSEVSAFTDTPGQGNQAGVVLEAGRLYPYASIEEAIRHHDHLMRGQTPPWLQRDPVA